jgi:NADP-dependent 3-hydroxy acid dehydrogenase YdfG
MPLSQAMRQDMLKHNIKVTEVGQDFWKTEILARGGFKGDKKKAKDTYAV